jgi:soluble lytic murein transglycosylase-like protein
MPNHAFDDLFDQWGAALNVNPQLGKTVFHVESGGDANIRNGSSGEIGGMQIMPGTGREMAIKLGLDPKAVNLHDMRWAVPLAMQYLADGLNATQSAEGAFGYYNSGSADPKRWRQSYIDKAVKLYPGLALAPPTQEQVPPAQENGPLNGPLPNPRTGQANVVTRTAGGDAQEQP